MSEEETARDARRPQAAQEEPDGGEAPKSRINLTTPQVVAGGVATLAAATAASFLGVYGTILGAAIMSVISTAGTAVAQHLMEQSRDKAKAVAVSAGRTMVHRGPRASTAVQYSAGSGQEPDATTVLAPVHADGPDDGAVGAGGVGDSAGAGGDGDRDGGPGGGEEPKRGWRRYRVLVISAVVVFAAVMLVILAFELLTGRSLSDTVHGRTGESGPTLLGGAEQTTDGEGGVDAPATTDPSPGTGEQGETTAPEDGGSTTEPDPGTGGDGDGGDGTEDGGATTDPGTGSTPDPGEDDTGGSDEGPGGSQEEGTEEGGDGGTNGSEGSSGSSGSGDTGASMPRAPETE